MAQFIFFTLFIVALIVGAFSYYTPKHPVTPFKFMMENSGLKMVEVSNRKRIQAFNITNDRGLIKIRGQMQDIALEQNRFLDTLQDQQQLLKNSSKQAADIMLDAQLASEKGDKDILQLKALAMEMQNEQRLLVAHGEDLITLGNQLTQSRQWVANQIELAHIGNGTSLPDLQHHYALFRNQANTFFDKVSQHNQEVHDQITRMHGQLHGLVNNAAFLSAIQEQNTKEQIGLMLDKEREEMLQLADSTASTSESMQQSRDKIEDERQNAQDQQEEGKERVADQMQRMQDQQDQRNQ